MIVLLALLIIMLVRGFGMISLRQYETTLLVWVVIVTALIIFEQCWQQYKRGKHETA